MPSNFETGFENDDVIEVDHVKQYAKPLNELESGLAHYRVATGSGAPYVVDFQADADPDVRKHHITTDSFTPIEDRHPLQAGQAIVFKANIDSPANASLQLTLEDGASGTASATFPLHVGDDQVGLEQIKQDQIVMAVYNDNPSRFDVISLGAGGSAGATQMGQLTDVDFSTPPADQDFIQHNGTAFVPKSPAEVRASLDVPTTSHTHAISDVTNLQASLDAKQNTLTDYTDVPNLSGELTSLGDDISANTTAISGKQDSAPVLAEIAGLDESPSALAKGDMLVHDGTNMQKLPSGSDGQILSANAAAGNGLGVEWSTPMGTGAVDSVFGRTGNVSAASGDYDASEVSDDSGVTSPAGTVADALSQLGSAISANTTSIGNNASSLGGKEDTSNKNQNGGYAGLDGSGLVPLDRGGTGADLSTTGGSGQVLKQSSTGGALSVSALSAGDMPSGIDAAKIAGGSVSNTEFEHLDGVTGGIQSQLNGKQDQDATLDQLSGLSLAKGDLLVHDGSSLQNLSAGSNGQVLQANSATASGMEWATPSSGGGFPSAIFGSADRSSLLSITSSTDITWNTMYSGGGMTTSGASGFRVPEAGFYLVQYSINYDYNAGNATWVTNQIRINNSAQSFGTSSTYIIASTTDTNTWPNMSGTAVFSLSTNDVVELYSNVGSIDMYIRKASFTVVKLGD